MQGNLTQLVMAAEGSTPSRMNREGAARTYSLYQWVPTCACLEILLMMQADVGRAAALTFQQQCGSRVAGADSVHG